MAEFTVGQASILLVPSFRGFAEAIDAESARWGDSAGGTFGDSFSARAAEGTKDAIGDQDADAAAKGDSAGGKFADLFKARIDAAVKSLPDAKINGDSSDVDHKLAEIRLELIDLGNKKINVDLSDDRALAQLAFLKAALAEVSRSSESVSVKVDTGGALGALSGISGAAGGSGGGLATLGEDASGAGFSISNVLIPALVLLGTTLIPIGGLALGALSTLPAILAGAGAGAGALVLGFHGILPAITAYSATLNTAGETTAQIATKQRDLTNALAGLTPAGQQFVQFVGSQLLPVFKSIADAAQTALLPGITAGLQAMEPLFTVIGNNIVIAAKGIGDFFNQLGHLVSTQTSLYEINGIFKAGAGFMKDLAKAVLDVVPAFLTIGQEAGPILRTIGKYIDDAAKAFAGWVSNGGFEKFVEWLKTNGPGIVKTLGDLVGSFVKITIALAPIGTALLKFIGWIFQVIAVIAEVIHWMGEWALLLVPMIAPIVLIGQYWNAVWSAMRDTAIAVWNAIYNNVIRPIAIFLGAVIPGVLAAFEAIWDTAWKIVSGAVSIAWFVIGFIIGAIHDGVQGITDVIDTLAFVWGAVWSGLSSAVSAAWAAIKPIIDTIASAVKTVADALSALEGSAGVKTGPNIPSTQGGGNIYFPHRAAGGPINGPAIVGENGPEIFLPNVSGYVVPSNVSLALLSRSGGSNGPVMHSDVTNIASPVDAVALGQQLTFLQRAGRL